MKTKAKWLVKLVLRIKNDTQAQDMVEYALLAGFITVSAGALLPPIAVDISTIFSKMGSVLATLP